MPEPDTHKMLLEGLKNGDHDAYKAVFDLYWDPLFSYALRKIKSSEDAKEIVQSLFLQLWEGRERIDDVNLDHFLKVCIRNKCVDFIRRQLLQGRYTEHCRNYTAIAAWETQNAISVNEIARQVEFGLKYLPEKSQQVFRLSRFEGYSTREIADEIQLSEKSVQYHLTKAMKVMKVCLKDFILTYLLVGTHASDFF